MIAHKAYMSFSHQLIKADSKECSHPPLDVEMEIALLNRLQQEELAKLHRYSSSSLALQTVDFRT